MADISGPYRVQERSAVAGTERAEVRELLAAARAAGKDPPLSELQQSALDRGGAPEFIALFCRSRYGHALAAYGQLCGEPGGWALEMVIHPECGHIPGPAITLLDAAVEAVRHEGGGLLRYWATRHAASDDTPASARGFAVERDLLQLRVALPITRRATTPSPPGLRNFVVGRDELRWLEINNRAFDGHPEQGSWDLPTLVDREKEHWFDPAGFFLLEIDGRLAGSCWTKVHSGPGAALGEIYVICVDPAFAHRGLGRALLLAGLDHLANSGLTTGMLYVDAANEPALALYRSVGFGIDHTDRAYLLEIR